MSDGLVSLMSAVESSWRPMCDGLAKMKKRNERHGKSCRKDMDICLDCDPCEVNAFVSLGAKDPQRMFHSGYAL